MNAICRGGFNERKEKMRVMFWPKNTIQRSVMLFAMDNRENESN